MEKYNHKEIEKKWPSFAKATEGEENRKYDHRQIESKWHKIWAEKNVAKIDKDDTKNKYYVLDMFPYPSGDGLHMGHTESYTASDVFYRFKKMQGYNVLHPQGFDAFGLPAENFAIKTGVHPAQTTEKNIANYIRQMKMLGINYDFDEQAITSDPKYYKWTQWIFEQFYKNDLVYKRTQKANWCPSCQTVIANEQVVTGECERCGTEIVMKEVPGWFFKITDFADDLIDDLDKVDWPEHTKKNQRNWIGKSEGAKIRFKVKITDEVVPPAEHSGAGGATSGSNFEIEVFTTRPDTLFGATYMVLAPENKLVMELKGKITNWDDVEKYIIQTQNKTEMDRIEAKEKTGVKLEGVFAINPANNEEIPIFIADYVLGGYGTGAIMAVPAHDERDYAFASKYGLSIKKVIEAKNFQFPISNFQTNSNNEIQNSNKEFFTDNGIVINSGEFTGIDSEEAQQKITEFVGGEMTSNYRLRDWSISRQRYWGCPIPIIYCGKCLENHKTQAPNYKQNTNSKTQNSQTTIIDGKEYAVVLVPESNLPIKLPTDVDFKPTGESPLKYSKSFNEVSCPVCGSTEDVFPEYDTMDTFVDSSWYFLRYPDVHNEEEFCSKVRKKWLPVDLYIGGAEHTYMHLLFARFFTKAMNKIGLLDFDEPFLKLRHQGMVLDAKGKKMSKSKGNVVNPDEMVERFGADSVRAYMLFAAPLEDEVIWNEDNIVGIYRFLEKVWRIKLKVCKVHKVESQKKNILHKTIKKVSEDIEVLKYNTAISSLMILVNEIEKEEEVIQEDYEMLLKILSPFAPHITQELWEQLGNEGLIQNEEWPKYDENLAKDSTHKIVLQVNGKVRSEIEIFDGMSENEVKKLALENEIVKKWTGGFEPKMIIYVKNRLVNVVI